MIPSVVAPIVIVAGCSAFFWPPGDKPGPDPSHRVVADFESEPAPDTISAEGSTADRAAASARSGQFGLRWSLEAGEDYASLDVKPVPADIRGFRTLRFAARADRDPGVEIDVRLVNSRKAYLVGTLPKLSPTWTTVEIPLPEMRIAGPFDPEKVSVLALVAFGAKACDIDLDDIAFVSHKGGWRETETEMMERVFGKDRVSKVKKTPTKHFDVFTDSKAAQGEFPKMLEKEYDFVKATLACDEMTEKLPIYIFQNKELYVDFCVRNGWTKEAAHATGGHGGREYFAAPYQAPNDPVVVHELTHSIFHRTIGGFGGSWFQEGVAVFIENAWQKKSAAFEFSSRLRSGQYVPLGEFVAMARLINEEDKRGGARNAASLYPQAGAFFEFLFRGPYATVFREKLKELARARRDDGGAGKALPAVLGKSLEEIEKSWIEWGGKPPRQ